MENEMKGARGAPGILVRMPEELKTFLADQAARYGSSQNSEIIRAIRERMERLGIREIPAQAGE
jgi:hypothetical protein